MNSVINKMLRQRFTYSNSRMNWNSNSFNVVCGESHVDGIYATGQQAPKEYDPGLI